MESGVSLYIPSVFLTRCVWQEALCMERETFPSSVYFFELFLSWHNYNL